MNIVLVTDVWGTAVSGLTTALVELVRQLQGQGHAVTVIQPGQFRSWRWPAVPGLRLALCGVRRMSALIDAAQPDAIHIATEGPLGWAARRHCLARQLPFTTSFHSRLPEWLRARVGLPLGWGYAWLRAFHQPSQRVLVPTAGVLQQLRKRGFGSLREWSYGVDTRLFSPAAEPAGTAALGPLARPVSLLVGRMAPGKQIEDFLALDVPGSKVVCGYGPLLARWRRRHPEVHWLGELPRHELARVYAAADVLVFPGRADTLGQGMLEAMACGVPVAAYPVEGPRLRVGESAAGALDEELLKAWSAAVRLPRRAARERALAFAWGPVAERFVAALAVLPAQGRRQARRAALPGGGGPSLAGVPGAAANLSHKRHRTVQ